jgi:regulator of protease activity HflC (stomatin/prohibitin superfamily)
MEFLYSVAIVFAIILVIAYFLYSQFEIVESEHVWIVDRLGKDRVLKEGINRFIPILDKKVAIVDMREFRIDPPEEDIVTKDNISIKIDAIASVKIIDPLKAIKEVQDYEGNVKNLISTSVLSVMGGMELQEIQANVDELTKQMAKRVEEDSLRWGIKVINVRIERVILPESIKIAMSKKIEAENEGAAKIKSAEAKSKADEIEAKSQHKVMALHAQSEQYMIEKRSEATYKAIKNLKELMPDISDEKIMNFLTSSSYIDSMKALSSSENSKFVLYPSDVRNPMDKIMSSEYMSQSMNSIKTAKAE